MLRRENPCPLLGTISLASRLVLELSMPEKRRFGANARLRNALPFRSRIRNASAYAIFVLFAEGLPRRSNRTASDWIEINHGHWSEAWLHLIHGYGVPTAGLSLANLSGLPSDPAGHHNAPFACGQHRSHAIHGPELGSTTILAGTIQKYPSMASAWLDRETRRLVA